MLRTISFNILLGASAVLAGCAHAERDPSLHPPGSPVKTAGTTVIRDLSRFDFQTGYPKRFLEQRVAFTAACEASARSESAGAAGDAKLLLKIGLDSKSPDDFASQLQGKFELVQVESSDPAMSAHEGMLTGYATPEVIVRSKPDERFRFPIFGDIRQTHPELAGKTRRELCADPAAREIAIAWIDDPLGWALVETNGTAKLKFDDGGVKQGKPARIARVSRVGTNGREWTSIGRWLANRGMVDATYTFADVAGACASQPERAEQAALDNERVVFFEEVGEERFPPALGIDGAKLMPLYSCAADQSIYPPGSVLVVIERGDGAARAARFLFVHDAGGAIKGPGRVDVYFGEGTEALVSAGKTRTPIEVYRLKRRN